MESLASNSKIKLNDGKEIPVIGFGTWKIPEGEDVEKSIKSALDTGYRMIDTAMIYGNETGSGKAIKGSGLSREEIFVTTKLWNQDQGYEKALKAIDWSLKRLGLDYVDLYLVHWPSAVDLWAGEISINKREETWKAMEEILKMGKAKSIGVSNYTIKHLEEMKSYAKIQPAVNQVEFHPFLYQEELLVYCKKEGIVLEAYSPLAKGKKLNDDRISQIAKTYGKTNAQIFLRWSIQHGALPIPKSTHPERIKENINIFDFEISAEDMKKIDLLNENIHLSWNPSTIE